MNHCVSAKNWNDGCRVINSSVGIGQLFIYWSVLVNCSNIIFYNEQDDALRVRGLQKGPPGNAGKDSEGSDFLRKMLARIDQTLLGVRGTLEQIKENNENI